MCVRAAADMAARPAAGPGPMCSGVRSFVNWLPPTPLHTHTPHHHHPHPPTHIHKGNILTCFDSPGWLVLAANTMVLIHICPGMGGVRGAEASASASAPAACAALKEPPHPPTHHHHHITHTAYQVYSQVGASQSACGCMCGGGCVQVEHRQEAVAAFCAWARVGTRAVALLPPLLWRLLPGPDALRNGIPASLVLLRPPARPQPVFYVLEGLIRKSRLPAWCSSLPARVSFRCLYVVVTGELRSCRESTNSGFFADAEE